MKDDGTKFLDARSVPPPLARGLARAFYFAGLMMAAVVALVGLLRPLKPSDVLLGGGIAVFQLLASIASSLLALAQPPGEER